MFSQHEMKHKGVSRLVSVFSLDIQEEKSRFCVDLGPYRIILSTGVEGEDTDHDGFHFLGSCWFQLALSRAVRQVSPFVSMRGQGGPSRSHRPSC